MLKAKNYNPFARKKERRKKVLKTNFMNIRRKLDGLDSGLGLTFSVLRIGILYTHTHIFRELICLKSLGGF